MVTIDGQKMGKSLGNARSLKEMFDRCDPMTIRLYILRSHYRSPLDFSDEGMASAASALARIRDLSSRLEPSAGGSDAADQPPFVHEALSAFTDRLADDLDTPGGVAVLFDYVRKCNQALEAGAEPGARSAMRSGLDMMAQNILGLTMQGTGSGAGGEETLLGLLAESRSIMRKARLFAEADRMRDILAEEGYSVKDLPGGESSIERISSAP